MTHETYAEDIILIQKLNDDFCYELDRGTPEGFAALFTEDVIYTRGDRKSYGRDEVLAFAIGRTAKGPRTARHIANGLRIEFENENNAKGLSCCVTFAASAEPPIQSTEAVLVADFHDTYKKTAGKWLFKERHIVAIFEKAPN